MDEEEIRDKLQDEGFDAVYSVEEEPEKEYGEHAHDTKTAHWVVNGHMTLIVDGKVVELDPGERFDIPAHVTHIAKMGTEGCRYVVGE
jgi:mannose-6-phosphate isomerase-like protein (cupin superfamily)